MSPQDLVFNVLGAGAAFYVGSSQGWFDGVVDVILAQEIESLAETTVELLAGVTAGETNGEPFSGCCRSRSIRRRICNGSPYRDASVADA